MRTATTKGVSQRSDIEIKESILNESGGYEYSVESAHAMLYLTYNIFNGFADKSMIEKEFAFYLQNKELLSSTKRDVISKLGVAWIASVKIEEQLKLLDKLRDYSKKTLEDYYQEFGIGRRTLLDISNVKNDYNNARQSYEAAKYDLILSKFRILEAMGAIVDYFTIKSDALNITFDDDFVENKSVYDIIEDMNKKLISNDGFINYDESKYETFDKMVEDYDTGSDLDDDPYSSLEELEKKAADSNSTNEVDLK